LENVSLRVPTRNIRNFLKFSFCPSNKHCPFARCACAANVAGKDIDIGLTIAQAVSRRIPIAAARVRAQVRSCGICGGQSGTGAGFLRVLRVPLLIRIPPTAQHSSSIIRGWYKRPNGGTR
jgi:hypothetical protein